MIAGFARAGRAAAASLAKHAPGSRVYFNDDLLDPAVEDEAIAAAEALGASRVRFEGTESLQGLTPAPVTLIKSPGINFNAPLIEAATACGIGVIDEAELGWRLDHRPFIAITGTNGKSTVVALTMALLAESDIEGELGGNNTFGPPLSALSGDGEIVVAETSSFQLEGCPSFLPDIGLLTNLTHDHHYRHGGAQEYAAVKRSMFIRDQQHCGRAAVGVDQEFGRELAAELRALGSEVVTFGFDPASDRRVLAVQSEIDSSIVTISEGAGQRVIGTKLPGAHNAQNVAAAFAISDLMELDPERTAEAVARTSAPSGRMERIETASGPEVFVDFGHNPDGVASVLSAARDVLERRGKGSLVAVLSNLEFTGFEQGHALGRAAGERADTLVLTTHRPRTRFRHGTLAPGLQEGAEAAGHAQVVIELDRREAMRSALQEAGPDDVVIFLERGAATSMLYDADNVGTPFDDRIVARELVAELGLSR